MLSNQQIHEYNDTIKDMVKALNSVVNGAIQAGIQVKFELDELRYIHLESTVPILKVAVSVPIDKLENSHG